MRIVLDTNIFLSALISPYGTSNIIYRAWRMGRFEIVTSKIQLKELQQASRYPKFKSVLQPSRVGTMINNFQHAIILDNLTTEIEADDPNDTFLLSMAISGKADYLITGDRRAGILQKRKIKRTHVLSPADFCSKVLSK